MTLLQKIIYKTTLTEKREQNDWFCSLFFCQKQALKASLICDSGCCFADSAGSDYCSADCCFCSAGSDSDSCYSAGSGSDCCSAYLYNLLVILRYLPQ